METLAGGDGDLGRGVGFGGKIEIRTTDPKPTQFCKKKKKKNELLESLRCFDHPHHKQRAPLLKILVVSPLI